MVRTQKWDPGQAATCPKHESQLHGLALESAMLDPLPTVREIKREDKLLKESLKVGATWRRNRSVLFDHAQTTNPNDTNRKLGYVPIGH